MKRTKAPKGRAAQVIDLDRARLSKINPPRHFWGALFLLENGRDKMEASEIAFCEELLQKDEVSPTEMSLLCNLFGRLFVEKGLIEATAVDVDEVRQCYVDVRCRKQVG